MSAELVEARQSTGSGRMRAEPVDGPFDRLRAHVADD